MMNERGFAMAASNRSMRPRDYERAIAGFFDTIDDARAQILAFSRYAFPIGYLVSYRHGKQIRVAKVVAHGTLGLSVKVQGQTGSEYWVDIRKLVPKTNGH